MVYQQKKLVKMGSHLTESASSDATQSHVQMGTVVGAPITLSVKPGVWNMQQPERRLHYISVQLGWAYICVTISALVEPMEIKEDFTLEVLDSEVEAIKKPD
jgi:hypothetical protein